MAYFGENWDDAEFPQAYLITIRTYGTWLHGDERRSVDTHDGYNARGFPDRAADPKLRSVMTTKMSSPAMVFNKKQRLAVRKAIEEVCQNREYILYALSVRSNHGHAVVRAEAKPEVIADSFKAYGTRKLRDMQMVDPHCKIWARGRSRRYLWKSNHVDAAIDYVTFCQSDYPFEEWYSSKFDD